MADSVVHHALDGSEIVLSGSDFDYSGPVTGVVVALVGRRGEQQEFTVGRRELGATVAELQEVHLDEEYSYSGGRLRIGLRRIVEPGVDTVLHLAVWEGTASSIFTHVYGSRAGASDLLALFDLFAITERDTYTTFLPREPASTPFEAEGPTLAKQLPGIGLAVVQKLTPKVAQRVPRWLGTPVAGGELFTERRDGRLIQFVLVGDTALTTLLPAKDADLDPLVRQLRDFAVSWA